MSGTFHDRWMRVVLAKDTSGTEVAVARALGRFADFDDGGDVKPGLDRLVEETHFAARTVRYALAGLLDQGLLTLVQRGGQRGRIGKASLYRLTIPKGQRVPDGNTDANRHDMPDGDRSEPAPPASWESPTGTTCHPQPARHAPSQPARHAPLERHDMPPTYSTTDARDDRTGATRPVAVAALEGGTAPAAPAISHSTTRPHDIGCLL